VVGTCSNIIFGSKLGAVVMPDANPIWLAGCSRLTLMGFGWNYVFF